MAVVTKYLWGMKGTLLLTGRSIPFWGFSPVFFSVPQLPAPQIEAKTGDTVRIVLFNSFLNPSPIGESISILFPGQPDVMVREWPSGNFIFTEPQYSDGQLYSLTNDIATGGFAELKALEYSLIVNKPGVYLYESGTRSERQILMGMYGVIVVRPEGYDIPAHPDFKTAYGAGTMSEYDRENILILSEIDSNLNNQIDHGDDYDMSTYHPDCWLVNGRTFPATVEEPDQSSQPMGSIIRCNTGDKVLLRIVNAGFNAHTLQLGGLVAQLIAEDGVPLVHTGTDKSYQKTSVTLGAGQRVDLIITPTIPGEYYLFDREYHHLVNNDEFPGGMMTKLEVAAT